jgi:hypothetical protein
MCPHDVRAETTGIVEQCSKKSQRFGRMFSKID